MFERIKKLFSKEKPVIMKVADLSQTKLHQTELHQVKLHRVKLTSFEEFSKMMESHEPLRLG